jgi:aminoglycoside 3-N-acetyltransferase I
MITSDHYTYQQLTNADVALLKDLLRVFGDAFGEVDTYQHSVPSDEYLTRLLNKEHFMAVVAMKGKEIVGGLAAYELDKFEQDRREIYICDLAVLEVHRRKGIATGMIGALRKIAAERDYTLSSYKPTSRMVQQSRCMSRWERKRQHIISTSQCA